MPANLHLFSANDSESEAGWIAQKFPFFWAPHPIHCWMSPTSRRLRFSLRIWQSWYASRRRSPTGKNSLEHAGIPCQVPSVEEFWNDEACAEIFRPCRQKSESSSRILTGCTTFNHSRMIQGRERSQACLARNKITLPAIGDWNLFGKSRAFWLSVQIMEKMWRLAKILCRTAVAE